MSVELPPRTRRILLRQIFRLIRFGTTSAYAENTQVCALHAIKRRNYLRVRGEYADVRRGYAGGVELPPRTRRILPRSAAPPPGKRTTSAYAENTCAGSARLKWRRNYLRVRGEYSRALPKAAVTVELPPRTRRIPQRASSCHKLRGTTSAYAENTGRA